MLRESATVAVALCIVVKHLVRVAPLAHYVAPLLKVWMLVAISHCHAFRAKGKLQQCVVSIQWQDNTYTNKIRNIASIINLIAMYLKRFCVVFSENMMDYITFYNMLWAMRVHRKAKCCCCGCFDKVTTSLARTMKSEPEGADRLAVFVFKLPSSVNKNYAVVSSLCPVQRKVSIICF